MTITLTRTLSCQTSRSCDELSDGRMTRFVEAAERRLWSIGDRRYRQLHSLSLSITQYHSQSLTSTFRTGIASLETCASTSSNFMALYKWFYLINYLLTYLLTYLLYDIEKSITVRRWSDDVLSQPELHELRWQSFIKTRANRDAQLTSPHSNEWWSLQGTWR